MNDFFNTISERFRSPIFGNFIFSWMVTNWKIPYITFFVDENKLNSNTKLDSVVAIINDYGCWKPMYLFVIPFCYTAFMVIALPAISNGVEMIRLHFLYKLAQYSEKKSLKFESIEKTNQKLNAELALVKTNSTNELKVNIFKRRLSLADIFIGTWMIQVVQNNDNLDYEDCEFKADKFISPKSTVLVFENFHISPDSNQSADNFRSFVNVRIIKTDTNDQYSISIESRDHIRLYPNNNKGLGFIILNRKGVDLYLV